MSIPVLTQVYDEVRRLAIAGSVVAPGDFRLKKLCRRSSRPAKGAGVRQGRRGSASGSSRATSRPRRRRSWS